MGGCYMDGFWPGAVDLAECVCERSGDIGARHIDESIRVSQRGARESNVFISIEVSACCLKARFSSAVSSPWHCPQFYPYGILIGKSISTEY